MNSSDRFDKLMRWYPPAWRDRYGEEMTALLGDLHGMSRMSFRSRLSVAKAGSLERARVAGVLGNSTGPSERIRGGSLLILCAWTFFIVAGSIFAKFVEHWDALTPRAHRWLPAAGYDMVQWAGLAGVALVLGAALAVAPAFLQLVRTGGWESVRRPVLRALAVVGVAVVSTAGIVVWGTHQRNGGSLPYEVAGALLVVVLATALALCTAGAVTVARKLDLSQRLIRVLGTVAIVLTSVMAVVTAGTIVWWGSVAVYAPAFLGGGPLSTSNVTPPPMLVAGILMLVGLSLAMMGTLRIARSMGSRI
jgi:hypothetical protein